MVVVALINLAPLLGIVSAQTLEAAYSVSLASNDLVILMRHRALLFGILGAFTLYAAFVPNYQYAAMLMAGASMVGFAVLVITSGEHNASIAKVLLVDYLGIAFLIAAVFLKLLTQKYFRS